MATKDGSGTRMTLQVHVHTPQVEGIVIRAGTKKNPLCHQKISLLSSGMKLLGCLGVNVCTKGLYCSVPNSVPFLGLIFHLKAICLNEIKYA